MYNQIVPFYIKIWVTVSNNFLVVNYPKVYKLGSLLGSMLEKIALGLWTLGIGTGAIAASQPIVEEKTVIHILDDSYGDRPLPKNFKEEVEIREDHSLSAEFPMHQVPIIPTTDPEEIEQILRQNPAAYKAFENKRNWSRNLSWSSFLQTIAQLTRDLEGKSYSEGRGGMGIFTDPLEYLIADSSAEYYTDESFKLVMQRGVAIAKKLPSPRLYDFTLLAASGFRFAYNVDRRDLILQQDVNILNILADFYESVVDQGLGLNNVKAEDLARIYYNLPENNKVQQFRQALQEAGKFVEAVERIQPGLTRYGALSVLIGAANPDGLKYGLTVDGIREGAAATVSFLKILKNRGEQHLGQTLQHLKWYTRGEFTPEFLDQLLELHQTYGIIEFGRLQNNEGSLIYELLQNRDQKHNADKPVALVTMPRDAGMIDTFSLGKFYEMMKELSQGYKLLVFSIASEGGLLEAAKKAQQLTGKLPEVFVFGGHGEPDSINFGVDEWEYFKKKENRVRGKGHINYGTSTAEQRLDLSDGAILQQLAPYIAEDAKVILYSCSTGKGKEYAQNMANTVAYNLPGRIVYAPDNVTEGVRFELDEQKKVKDVKFLSGERPEDSGPTETYGVTLPQDMISDEIVKPLKNALNRLEETDFIGIPLF